ncbi:triose-phosphate isomerase [bacterium]|nr:triose-phosphate isomerase [bacterium]
MRRPIIAGNWKMYLTLSGALDLVKDLKERLKGIADRDIVVIPPFTYLHSCHKVLEGSNINIGAQDMHWEKEGAFTGEVSPFMLTDCGCKFCVIGHSERRAYFHETDEMVNKKIKSALIYGIIPICCIGETLEQREADQTFDVIEGQVRGGFAGLTSGQMGRVIIAYEPVWAIGTGRTATPEQANEVHAFIRGNLAGLFDTELANNVRIQYGGSVKPENCDDLMSQPDIDGALVGGASLKADSFARIVGFK